MPELDFFAMTMAVSVNLMAVAFAMPWFMGQQVSASARRSQQFLLLQGLSWVMLLSSILIQSPIWSTVLALFSFVIAVISLVRLSRALLGWLGPRSKALQQLLNISCVLGALGYMALAQSPTGRNAWFFGSYGISLFLVGSLALRPHTEVGRLWRYMLFGVSLCMSLILLLRSFLTLNPGWLLQYTVEDDSLSLLWTTVPPIGSVVLLLAILLAWHDEAQRTKREQHQQDPLTGLPHRHALTQQAQTMLQRAQRSHQPFSIVLLEMDQLQQINRLRGNQVGNDALQLLSLVLQKQMRGDEVAARWRAESFCLLVHTDAAGIRALCTRLKSAIQLGMQHELHLHLSFSAGCVHVPEVWSELEFDDLVDEATRALNQARKAGPGGLKIISLQAPFHEQEPPAIPAQADAAHT